jgi:single-stranded DNA-specific DHH superfamily exonuclease
MLSEKEVAQLKDAVAHAKHPFVFFHDDPDGLASFLLLYRTMQEGRGFCLKAFPQVTVEYASKPEEYGADVIFVLDIAMVDQEFIDAVHQPIFWVDHHAPQQRERVKYYNPRVTTGENVCTPVLCWQVMGEQRPQDLWIATTGAIGDWYFPAFAKEFQKQRPDILPPTANTVQEAMFNSPLGTLIKVFSFNLKGPTSEVNKSIKILTRIDNPDEILKQTTPRGRLIWKKYASINKTYEEMLGAIVKTASKDRILVYTYTDDKLSLTKDLSNELLYKFPDKLIVLGREKEGEVRCSLRCSPQWNIAEALPKALVGIQGYGGGHEQACGAGIQKEDFPQFIENLRRELKL